MSPLITETKTHFKVEMSELERFIKQETGHEYIIEDREDFSENYLNQLVDVLPFDKLEYLPSNLIRKFIKDWGIFKKNGPANYQLSTILRGLCTDGKIPEGEYLIE